LKDNHKPTTNKGGKSAKRHKKQKHTTLTETERKTKENPERIAMRICGVTHPHTPIYIIYTNIRVE
jgi:hypothetical protein